MKKLNCWEFNRCGRGPGGDKVEELGLCPAAAETRLGGLNGGHNGGRSCWGVPGTSCAGSVNEKISVCLECPFLRRVQEEEGHEFNLMREIIQLLK